MICMLIEFQRLKKGCLMSHACEVRTPNIKTKVSTDILISNIFSLSDYSFSKLGKTIAYVKM